MATLLAIIYLTFISLGLPDSLLGSAWPVMQVGLNAPFAMAGFVSMTISAGTIVSSLFSAKLTSKFGTGKITLISVLATAIALFGISFAPNVYWLFLLAIPLGLGAGCVDSALNNFVALHYASKHMSWLHCFWGVGATAGPIIMAANLAKSSGYKGGYLTVSIIQFVLVLVLFVTLPLWKKAAQSNNETEIFESISVSNSDCLKIPNMKLSLVSFVAFSATEATTGLWSSSYLVGAKGLSGSVAALWVSYFYGGITVGRLLSGLFASRFKSATLIKAGQITCIVGAFCLILPLPTYFSMLGLIFIGLGTSPVFPLMLHETPNRFGKAFSASVMGLQMAVAYVGGMFAPMIFGNIATWSSMKFLPYYLLACILTMFIASELLQKNITK